MPELFWASLEWINSERIIAIWTVVLGVATCILGIATWKLWRATDRLVEGADATTKRQLRAYVFVKDINVGVSRHPDRIGVLNNNVIPGAIHTYTFSVVLENGGQTPTRHMITNFSCQIFPDGMPSDFDFPDSDLSGSAICGPRAIMFTPNKDVPATDILGTIGTSRKWYIWGWADYNDVFDNTPRHRTEFCFEIRVIRNEFTSEIKFGFPVHNKFNAADEDCMRKPTPLTSQG